MRFLKRSRSLLNPAWRGENEKAAHVADPAVSREEDGEEERHLGEKNAPPLPEPNAHDASPPGGEDGEEVREESSVGDPTQILLTALGRFQRSIVKGQTGIDQEIWCDECMNQLILAIETSVNEEWTTIVEALTDTARILHSYENAGSAHLCIPFLNDSYEILCLMVSDLIVDHEQSGVLEKWRERYQQAVTDLTAADIPLVQDEEEDRPLAPPPSSDAEAPPDKPETEPEQTLEGEGEAEDETETESAQKVGIVAILDSLCEEFAGIEKMAPSDRTGRFDVVADQVAALERHAVEKGHDNAEQICRRMAELCRIALLDDAIREDGGGERRLSVDRFLDTAYAFCEAYVDADLDPESPLAANWLSEMAALLENGQAAPAPPEAPKDPTSESFLSTAQQAIARGDLAGAKTLALQAAAHMAQAEVLKIEGWVQEAETRFKSNDETMEEARGRVKKAEQDVVIVEASVGEGESELASMGEATAGVANQLEIVQNEIAEFEEEIRRLQEAREEALEQARQIEAELEENRKADAQFADELQDIKEAEEAARTQLEGARQHVKDLERKRLDLEGALSRGRDMLVRQRASLDDIERTIAQFSGQENKTAADSGDLLF